MTVHGWERASELERAAVRTWQAFVAMSFSPEMTRVFDEAIKPALEATGYRAVRVDRVEYNDKIDDRIIAELRRSGLLVADFTGQRGGVYFEAGFGMGHGIPVIYCCRADEIDRVHFDTRQYNHITWQGPNELRQRLIDRIRATLPTRAPIAG